jgi:rod shape-determining protein MreD
MSRYAIGAPLLMLAAVIDASVLSHLRYANGQPSLLLLILAAWVLLVSLDEALPWAIMGGIFADLLSVTPTGASSLGFVLMMLALKFNFGQVGRRNWVLPPLAVILGTLIYQAVVLVFLILSGWAVSPLGALLRWMLPSLVMNALGMVIVFGVMGRVVEFFRPPRISAL